MAAPEHVAPTFGAVHDLEVERIDLLVVGLPVRMMKQSQVLHDLKTLLCGTHKLADGRKIHVARVQAFAQPVGSLMYDGAQHRDFDAIRQQVNFVIDSGFRTFDWIAPRACSKLRAGRILSRVACSTLMILMPKRSVAV